MVSYKRNCAGAPNPVRPRPTFISFNKHSTKPHLEMNPAGYVACTVFLIVIYGESVTGAGKLKWQPLPLTEIGVTNMNSAETFSFPIPDTVPDGAKKVLVYALLKSGYAGSTASGHIRIYTKNGDTEYSKYLFQHSYSQYAINTNSDNMWFTMPADRTVYFEVPHAFGRNCYAKVFVIGYV